MARTARHGKLDTRSARAKLAPRREPYWCRLGNGQALGYRRLDRNFGTWIAKLYDSATRTRRYQALGDADDIAEADGRDVLTFGQAQDAARVWFPKARFGEYANANSANSADRAPRTVAEAMAAYLAWLDAEGEASTLREAKAQAKVHILPALGAIRLDRLTAATIRQWRDTLAATPAKARKARADAADEEEAREIRRKRRSSTNRVLVTLRAALRHTEASHPGTMPQEPWLGAKGFKQADAARVRWLDRDEIARLLNAAPDDLRRLVRAALFSGCRYGELCRLKVGDFHPESGTLYVSPSKSGKARHVPLDDESRAFFAAVTAGRPRADPLLLKADGSPWKKDHQKRPMAMASEAARLDPPATVHCLRHSYASLRVMAGAPLPAVANALGHADTRMVEKHYGHLAPSWVADAIRATALGIGAGDEAEKVVALTTA